MSRSWSSPVGTNGQNAPALEAVDEVDRTVAVAALEGEERCEQLLAEAVRGQLAGDQVDAGDEVFEVAVADDEPLVAERVLAAADLGAGGLRHHSQQLVDRLFGAHELACRERLEDDAGHPGRAQAELGSRA